MQLILSSKSYYYLHKCVYKLDTLLFSWDVMTVPEQSRCDYAPCSSGHELLFMCIFLPMTLHPFCSHRLSERWSFSNFSEFTRSQHSLSITFHHTPITLWLLFAKDLNSWTSCERQHGCKYTVTDSAHILIYLASSLFVNGWLRLEWNLVSRGCLCKHCWDTWFFLKRAWAIWETYHYEDCSATMPILCRLIFFPLCFFSHFFLRFPPFHLVFFQLCHLPRCLADWEQWGDRPREVRVRGV